MTLEAEVRLRRSSSLEAEVRVRRGSLDLDLRLTARSGEVVAVLGPNGSGKTTLLLALAGLVPLQGGEIRLDGRVWDAASGGRPLPPERRRTGLVLADHLLFPHLRVVDNVAFGLRTRGVPKAQARERALAELTTLGLADRARARPAELSSGQAQRVALARALATDPELLLLDEPLSALDATTRAQTRADLGRRLRDYRGVTVLVTHDPLDALSLADHLVFVEGGRVVQEGSPQEVIARPRDPYVAQIIGLNLLSGHAVDAGLVQAGSLRVVTHGGPARGPVWVTVPPAAISLYRSRPDGSPRNTWSMTVRDIQLAGQSARVTLDGPTRLTAEVTAAAVADLRLQVGQELWASVKATEVRAYPA